MQERKMKRKTKIRKMLIRCQFVVFADCGSIEEFSLNLFECKLLQTLNFTKLSNKFNEMSIFAPSIKKVFSKKVLKNFLCSIIMIKIQYFIICIENFHFSCHPIEKMHRTKKKFSVHSLLKEQILVSFTPMMLLTEDADKKVITLRKSTLMSASTSETLFFVVTST